VTQARRKVRRSTVYAAVGVLLLGYEAMAVADPRPALLVVYVAMMGLPPIVAANEMVKRALVADEAER
jgi:hypothetical protein